MVSRSECECVITVCVCECVRLEGRGHQASLELSLPLSQCPKFPCLSYLGRNLHFGPQRKWKGGVLPVSSPIPSSHFQTQGSPEGVLGRRAGAAALNWAEGARTPPGTLSVQAHLPSRPHTHSAPRNCQGTPHHGECQLEPFLGLPPPHSPPSPLACSRPSSHPALPASARMATDTTAHTRRHTHTHTHTRRHTHTHTHRESQTFESAFWPISPPKDSSGPALLCLCVSRLCLWVGLAAFLRAAVFSSAGNLPPHTPTVWSGRRADHRETGLWESGGARLGESPFQPP